MWCPTMWADVFSVLTAVGLLPIAVSGADIDKLMEGAAEGRKMALEAPFEENDAVKYAALRNILLRKGKVIEILANYEPSAHYVSEWWKQLYGESEGKDQKGIFPASVDLTTDLHSMGQFIQDGSRTMFETVLNIETSREEIIIGEEPVDLDGLNYLAGKNVDFVNKSAMNGTILAHTDGQVPNFMINVPEVNEFYLGELFYFFFQAHIRANFSVSMTSVPPYTMTFIATLLSYFSFTVSSISPIMVPIASLWLLFFIASI